MKVETKHDAVIKGTSIEVAAAAAGCLHDASPLSSLLRLPHCLSFAASPSLVLALKVLFSSLRKRHPVDFSMVSVVLLRTEFPSPPFTSPDLLGCAAFSHLRMFRSSIQPLPPPEPPDPPDPPDSRYSPTSFSSSCAASHRPAGRHILSPIITKSTGSSFSDLLRSDLLCFTSGTARLTALILWNHLTNPFIPLRHNITTGKPFPPPPSITTVFSLAKIAHHSEVFPGVDFQFNLRALLNLWALPTISRSSFTLFMRLGSGRHVFMLFIVTSTGLFVGLSSDYSDLGSRVLLTCWCISNPTSAVQEYCQFTGVPLNLPLSIMEIDSKRSTALTTTPRAIHLVHSLSIANELEIVFETIFEALTKKLPVFIIDLNCLTYPF
ncbi:unnamed protein product [Microthlaspi erraticum]|uniref:Uncharacterized protein n=1 Tax=Microthlaspi erraticum TaxID=1685480 RepID=A0A6D2JKU0_9BRAS|nr:unnamed protein product [Microthlaspi erraticum]